LGIQTAKVEVMWKIDKDYINDTLHTSVGVEGDRWVDYPITSEYPELPTTPETTRFRLLDDDEIVYYGGWLHNDTECLNQLMALKYGKRDAGCTIIEVWNIATNKWEREIG
jgi:hypothetical protein